MELSHLWPVCNDLYVLDCDPLWVERYNMKGANGVLLSDVHGLDPCKSACVRNRACTSLHVYLNPRKGPTDCWLNYEPRGSSDPSSLLQSIRYLHLGLIDRCGASLQNVSQGIFNHVWSYNWCLRSLKDEFWISTDSILKKVTRKSIT